MASIVKSKHPIIILIKKDLQVEFRQKHTLFGMLLYMICTVFCLYMMNGQPEVKVWNALFWVAQLFITVNTVAKSFLQEPAERLRYYFTVVSPVHFMIAKLLYSLIITFIMTILSFLLFTILLGNPLLHVFTFMGVAILGAINLGFLFTFLSAVTAQARQSAAMMAVLGFPIAIPQLIILSKLSQTALSEVIQENMLNMFLILGFMSILIFVLSVILFPFLWQE